MEYTLLDGQAVLPGMLYWETVGPNTKRMVRFLTISVPAEGKKKAVVRVELEDGAITEVSSTKINPIYYEPPGLFDVPIPFQRDFSRHWGSIALAVGETVLFNDPEAFRELTGHAKLECGGKVAMFTEGALLIAGRVMVPAQEDEKPGLLLPVPFLMAVEESEVAVERDRMSMGIFVAVQQSSGERTKYYLYDPTYQRFLDTEMARENSCEE